MAPYCAQKNINISILSNLLIPLPPISLQKDFANKVAQIRIIAELQDLAFGSLEDLYLALVDQAFGGKLTKNWRMENAREDNFGRIIALTNKKENVVTEVDQTKKIYYHLIELLENNVIEQNALEFSDEMRITVTEIIQSIIESKDILRRNLIAASLCRSKRIIKILIDNNLKYNERIK